MSRKWWDSEHLKWLQDLLKEPGDIVIGDMRIQVYEVTVEDPSCLLMSSGNSIVRVISIGAYHGKRIRNPDRRGAPEESGQTEGQSGK